MLIAEELGSGPFPDPAGACSTKRKTLRKSPVGGRAGTGNSNAIRAAWQRHCAKPVRSPRTMLVSARQSAGIRSCVLPAQAVKCFNPQTGRRIKYSELATDAAGLPVPENVVLKRVEDFKLLVLRQAPETRRRSTDCRLWH